MKRAIIFVSILTLAVICISAVCVWLAPPPEQIVVPPSRFGTASASISSPETLAAATTEAEVVAHIRVGSWLGESELYDDTYFEAEVIEVFKGEIPGEFVLKQDGYSGFIYAMNPLFTYGNELLLFLNKGSEAMEYPYDDVYWILGSHGTVFYTGEDSSGVPYAVPSPANQLAKGVLANAVSAENGASTGDEILHSLTSSDPEMWSGGTVTTAYSLEQLGEKVRAICEANR